MSTAMVQLHSIEQYYSLIHRGIIQNNRDRIARWMMHENRPVTRHEIEHAFRPGAVWDGEDPIPWQSLGKPVLTLIRSRYAIESKERIADPITGNPAKTLTLDPIAYGQMRMF